jgi:hypothetical protein
MAGDNEFVDAGIRGAAVGAGFEAIRSGKAGIVDGVVSGLVLGVAWRGAVVLADKTGLKSKIEEARDKLRKQ